MAEAAQQPQQQQQQQQQQQEEEEEQEEQQQEEEEAEEEEAEGAVAWVPSTRLASRRLPMGSLPITRSVSLPRCAPPAPRRRG